MRNLWFWFFVHQIIAAPCIDCEINRICFKSYLKVPEHHSNWQFLPICMYKKFTIKLLRLCYENHVTSNHSFKIYTNKFYEPNRSKLQFRLERNSNFNAGKIKAWKLNTWDHKAFFCAHSISRRRRGTTCLHPKPYLSLLSEKHKEKSSSVSINSRSRRAKEHHKDG